MEKEFALWPVPTTVEPTVPELSPHLNAILRGKSHMSTTTPTMIFPQETPTEKDQPTKKLGNGRDAAVVVGIIDIEAGTLHAQKENEKSNCENHKSIHPQHGVSDLIQGSVCAKAN